MSHHGSEVEHQLHHACSWQERTYLPFKMPFSECLVMAPSGSERSSKVLLKRQPSVPPASHSQRRQQTHQIANLPKTPILTV